MPWLIKPLTANGKMFVGHFVLHSFQCTDAVPLIDNTIIIRINANIQRRVRKIGHPLQEPHSSMDLANITTYSGDAIRSDGRKIRRIGNEKY